MFKTLLAAVDGPLAVGIVPVSGQLDLKALAAAVGGKQATMADPAEAERATGYVVGGISPIGQRRPTPPCWTSPRWVFDGVYVSGGDRGLDLGLAPADLVRVTRRSSPRSRLGLTAELAGPSPSVRCGITSWVRSVRGVQPDAPPRHPARPLADNRSQRLIVARQFACYSPYVIVSHRFGQRKRRADAEQQPHRHISLYHSCRCEILRPVAVPNEIQNKSLLRCWTVFTNRRAFHFHYL